MRNAKIATVVATLILLASVLGCQSTGTLPTVSPEIENGCYSLKSFIEAGAAQPLSGTMCVRKGLDDRTQKRGGTLAQRAAIAGPANVFHADYKFRMKDKTTDTIFAFECYLIKGPGRFWSLDPISTNGFPAELGHYPPALDRLFNDEPKSQNDISAENGLITLRNSKGQELLWTTKTFSNPPVRSESNQSEPFLDVIKHRPYLSFVILLLGIVIVTMIGDAIVSSVHRKGRTRY